MASPSRRNSLDLIAALHREPHRFGFFQAMRLLALAGPPGADPLPRQLRLRTPASLAFPASEITRGRQAEGAPLELEVSFLGLTGPSGVLPRCYTETVLERSHLHKDGALHAFLDIFNHRACGLFYAAWRKYHFHIGFEQGQGDRFTGHLADLLTVRPPGAEAKAAIPQLSLIHFAGAFARRPLPAGALVAFVGAFFGAPARLRPYAGQWTAAPPGQQTRLGGGTFGLGAGAFLGERLWDQQNKVSLRLGPLAGPAFRDFLPGRPGAEALRQFVKLNLGELLACDLELELRQDAIPALALDGAGPDSPRLGLNTWLHSRPLAGPRPPVAFRLQA
jgi:type VI secretion system protein ImpH